MRERVRAMFPPSGRGYECFDTSAFLFLYALVGYILFDPPRVVGVVLAAPLVVVNETQLGWALAAASLVGIVCSYLPDYHALGFLLPRIASFFMAANFIVTLAVVTVDQAASLCGMAFLPPGFDHASTFRVAFLYALIFGWACRRLSRDDTA